MIKAGVPEKFRRAKTKPSIAIEEINRVAAAGAHFGCVLADAGDGLSASFRQAFARDLSWTGLHRHALMTRVAYAFLQYRRLAMAGRKETVAGPPPQPSLPAVRHAIFDCHIAAAHDQATKLHF